MKKRQYIQPLAEVLSVGTLPLLTGSEVIETKTFDSIFYDEEHDPEEAL
jgi:hypothetical protein